MNFFTLLRSLDELLYEVMSWLVFYPVTLWRALRHPRRMMDYADTELGDSEDRQYTDTLSPPLFLLLTLVLGHAIELAVVGENSIVRDKVGLAGLIDSDTNLVLLRVVIFGLFPLIMATRLVRGQRIGLERATLRPPFYSQCYIAAPFALVLGIAAILVQLHWVWAPPIGVAMIVATLLWYGSLQIDWFSKHLRVSRWQGLWQASLAMIESLVAASIGAVLFS
ncbi:hypothetical protein [Sphingomonas colocasiae]|uniref:Permease n=1 Tax=Sphingomonas colocasiae TaxID=1848973 RepID=A0ABS7PI11_9SPHN|nr:hypothetical protein [Sphingomonas colocasiae]MBY8820928.1 hypothetical protein [Sphingomonas colocasiae]